MNIPSSIINMGFLESDAEAILAIPSGLVAVRECGDCGGKGYTSFPCETCRTTGLIRRDMSVQEVIEWATGMINGNIPIEPKFVVGYSNSGKEFGLRSFSCFTKSGERIEEEK